MVDVVVPSVVELLPLAAAFFSGFLCGILPHCRVRQSTRVQSSEYMD